MASRIFLTAVELDVFALLDTGKWTAAEMARRMGADTRATEVLLNALTSMGLLEKAGDKFANTKAAAKLLVPDSREHMGGFGHAVHLWEAWSHLTEVVRSGRPFVPEPTHEARRECALCMKQYATGTAQALSRLVDFSDVDHMLDLGGGAGACGIALARQHPHMRIVLFDVDQQALALAREDITSEGLQDRIVLKSGDFFSDDIGEGYDLVLLSSVICLFGEPQNLSLLGRARACLEPGGKIVIVDAIVDGSHTRPTAAALFAVNLLVTSHSGQSYSHQQVEGWLRSVGFVETRRIPLHRAQVIVAHKGDEGGLELGP